MSYRIKEIYYTLQGEGFHTGRPAVFLRFSECNLWSGYEADRPTSVCPFCDTDFVGTDGPGGGVFETSRNLAQTVQQSWPEASQSKKLVVCTGGEPLLQLDQNLVDALHQAGFEIALETNGTLSPPRGIDWTCVSPKAGSRLVLEKGDELKLVFPQTGIEPQDYLSLDFTYFYLQPMAGPQLQENTELALRYCLKHPEWTLSLQIHKILNIP